MVSTKPVIVGVTAAGQRDNDQEKKRQIADEQPAQYASSQQQQQNKCVTIIFNPVSGTGDPEKRKRRIEAALAQHGYRCQHLVTTPEQDARYHAQRALQDGVDLIAVSGGDGTVAQVMGALVGTDVPLAIFPAGTGNLLSVNLKLPTEVSQAVHAALFGTKRPLDLARLRTDTGWQTYFTIIAGAGYDALIMRDADRRDKRRIGPLAYLLAALKNLDKAAFSADITLERGDKKGGDLCLLRRRAKSVMVANMGRLQGGLTLVPGAWPDDGRLEVTILKAETLWDWLRLVGNALRGRIADDPAIEYHAARRVHVRFRSPQPLQHDGEPAGPVRAFSAEIVPGAVQVMVPADAPV